MIYKNFIFKYFLNTEFKDLYKLSKINFIIIINYLSFEYFEFNIFEN